MSFELPLSRSDVEEALNTARKLVSRWVPSTLEESAQAALNALAKRPDEVALLGGIGLARMNSWWATVAPFSAPPAIPLLGSGAQAAYAAMQSMVDRRDAEIRAMNAITEALVDIGWEGVKAALPFVIAALSSD